MQSRHVFSRRTLTIGLSAVFVVAMWMGVGPGVYLVNPDPADPQAIVTLLGVPVIYLWGLGWYLVQVAVVLAAYGWLWRGEDPLRAALPVRGEGGGETKAAVSPRQGATS